MHIAFRDVTPHFVSPINASLGQLNNSDRRGLDASIAKPTPQGSFNVNYQFLQSDGRSDERPMTLLHSLSLGWSKNIARRTQLSLGGNLARTKTRVEQAYSSIFDNESFSSLAMVNNRRFGLNLSLTETLGKLNVSVSGSRNWFIDRTKPQQSTSVASFSIHANWAPQPVFQLQTNVSINWFAGDKSTVGSNRSLTAYLQPAFNWQKNRAVAIAAGHH